MSDRSSSGGTPRPDVRHEPTVDMLRRAIDHVDQLLERLDCALPAEDRVAEEVAEEQPVRPELPEDGVAAATHLAAEIAKLPGPVASQTRALTEAVRLVLLARDAAERVRTQAHQASVDAAAKGQRLVSDAVRAAASLQADAERNWAESETWASEQSRAADAAIRALLATPESEAGVADVVDTAVREMDVLRVERRRRITNRR